MGWIDANELIREFLAVKANNEELTKRVERLELQVEQLNLLVVDHIDSHTYGSVF